MVRKWALFRSILNLSSATWHMFSGAVSGDRLLVLECAVQKIKSLNVLLDRSAEPHPHGQVSSGAVLVRKEN